MKSAQPIGIFDSGVGGTSIWKEIHQLMPMENTIYLADSKFAPYGNKPREDIVRLSIKNTEKLIDMGAKIIVVACNTATTNAISILRANYDLPFVGIEPAIKPAALKSKTGRIGILATRGTLSSALFSQTSEAFASDIKVVEVVGEGLVPLIENGQLDSSELHTLLIKYLDQMIEAKIDYLVLGCSHYPYLIPKLREMLPKNVTIIDSGAAVARQTKNLLQKHNLLNTETSTPSLEFYSNSETTILKSLLGDHSEITVDRLDF
ncbi:glutamate racemase [Aureitalea sp. L0-47]|uniref:glutamate racemase n=1 Tax=Aureitalea sp. L0-47 TaxID=2816962 RepID=UPI002238E4CF|nr:glutamate racemase [Aureitalea sp. L0-47]MCW5521101.1 glutamate racemase [Aureitalea sp. L0-47]